MEKTQYHGIKEAYEGKKSNFNIYGTNTNSKVPPAVNWHITKKCNFNCVYCFANFNGIEGTLPKNVALTIPKQLKEIGVEKLNIAGGEPLLYPHIIDVLKESKNCGLTVTMISNGSLLDEDNIKEMGDYVDWIGLSLDSCDKHVQYKLGRGTKEHISKIVEKAHLIKKNGMGLKINTVVTQLNKHEDMRHLISRIDPDRWKVFQVMEREGENHEVVEPFLIAPDEFQQYAERNDMILTNGSTPKFESNELMDISYVMMDPLGRFFHYPVDKIEYIPTDSSDIASSIQNVIFDYEAFKQRGGIYDWKRSDECMTQINHKHVSSNEKRSVARIDVTNKGCEIITRLLGCKFKNISFKKLINNKSIHDLKDRVNCKEHPCKKLPGGFEYVE